MHVVTDCGHPFKTGYSAETCSGATIDCKGCGRLLIFPTETTVKGASVVRARDFHVYLNEGDSRWPRDGKGTGWLDFAAGDVKVPI